MIEYYSIRIGSFEKTQMAASNPENARSAHHLTRLAPLSNGATVLDPGSQRTAQAVEIHTRASPLYGLLLGSHHSARNGIISRTIRISSQG